MTITLDVSKAIRHPDLARVVQAVFDADEHDEADWIEWKSTLDLTSKEGCFHVARAVLGLANRLPEAAAKTCEGLGYVVVGVEPGKVVGVASVDPATLDQMLEPYLGGAQGPRYTPSYIPSNGKTTLVVTVEAPRAGDPVHMLGREFDGYRDGIVFIRKHGRTVPANSADQRALHARLLASPPVEAELIVSLVGDVPLSWFDASTTAEVIDAWVAGQCQALESAAREEERRYAKPVPAQKDFDSAGIAGAMAAFARHEVQIRRSIESATRVAAASGLLGEPDKRTIDEYLAEVEDWAARAKEAAPRALAARYLSAGHGLVAVRVENPTGRFLPKVEVEVRFDWERLVSLEHDQVVDDLPVVPWPYGKTKPPPSLSAFAPILHYPSSSYADVAPPARSWVEEGSVKIVFDVGDLRQEEVDTSDSHYLVLPERPREGVLHGTWKATVPDMHGVIRGELDIPVHDAPVDLRHLLDSMAVQDDDE